MSLAATGTGLSSPGHDLLAADQEPVVDDEVDVVLPGYELGAEALSGAGRPHQGIDLDPPEPPSHPPRQVEHPGPYSSPTAAPNLSRGSSMLRATSP